MSEMRVHKDKLESLDENSLNIFRSWLRELSTSNKAKTEAAAVVALTDMGGKQHHIALILLGAQQQLEALIKELCIVIDEG